jgi:hypothetical protein
VAVLLLYPSLKVKGENSPQTWFEIIYAGGARVEKVFW